MTPIQITLTADSVVVPNGHGGSKRISIPDFLAELQHSIVGNEESSSSSSRMSGFIPPSSLCAMYESGNHRSRTLVMYYPSTRADILHTGTDRRISKSRQTGYESCIIPNTVVVLDLEFAPTNEHNHRWTLKGLRYMATELSRSEVAALGRAPTISGGSGNHFYSLPFNNQYENGGMCTGGNALQSVFYNDFTVADSLYYNTLLGSPFNNDLGLRGVGVEVNNTGTWYQYLQYCNEFPYWYSRNSTVQRPASCQDISWDQWVSKSTAARNDLIKKRMDARNGVAVVLETPSPEAPAA